MKQYHFILIVVLSSIFLSACGGNPPVNNETIPTKAKSGSTFVYDIYKIDSLGNVIQKLDDSLTLTLLVESNKFGKSEVRSFSDSIVVLPTYTETNGDLSLYFNDNWHTLPIGVKESKTLLDSSYSQNGNLINILERAVYYGEQDFKIKNEYFKGFGGKYFKKTTYSNENGSNVNDILSTKIMWYAPSIGAFIKVEDSPEYKNIGTRLLLRSYTLK